MGEWNHLLAVHVTCKYIVHCHVLAVLLFLASGGLLASLNHTRHDVRITLTLPRIGTILIYDVRAHDVHHRLPRSNYGQYIMLWDRLLGSYKPYEDTIRPLGWQDALQKNASDPPLKAADEPATDTSATSSEAASSETASPAASRPVTGGQPGAAIASAAADADASPPAHARAQLHAASGGLVRVELLAKMKAE